MKKTSLIIGKKQIIAGAFALLLAGAAVVNYGLKKEKPDSTQLEDETVDAMYGDTVFVNAEEDTCQDDYFAEARIERDNNRDNAVATLQTVIGGGDISDDEMVSKAIEAVDMTKLTESEGNIESLIKSLGFEDCIVYLTNEDAKVVIKTDGLNSEDAAAIKNIILDEISISAEKIRIFEIK